MCVREPSFLLSGLENFLSLICTLLEALLSDERDIDQTRSEGKIRGKKIE